MSKIPKRLAKLHKEAVALSREERRLKHHERRFILEHFHEGATHMNSLAGAFFTPLGLAFDLAIEVPRCRRILDLCAGIGTLSYAVAGESIEARAPEVVCVELNPAYVEVGRAVMPDATWICASAFDLEAYAHLGPFDTVISNPPFGQIPAEGFEGKYTGGLFEYRLIELASRLARYGPFRYSGQQGFRHEEDHRARRFREQTGIEMQPNCGLDTSVYRDEWKGVSPVCEIVCCPFDEMELDHAPVAPRSEERSDPSHTPSPPDGPDRSAPRGAGRVEQLELLMGAS